MNLTTARETAEKAAALLARQMPGPWMWAGRPDDVCLCTAHSGRHYLLGCRRSGMDGAAFTFQFFDGDRPGIMHHAKKDGLLIPRAPYAQCEIVGIAHPLADLIKMIPEMVEALQVACEPRRSGSQQPLCYAVVTINQASGQPRTIEHCHDRQDALLTAVDLRNETKAVGRGERHVVCRVLRDEEEE